MRGRLRQGLERLIVWLRRPGYREAAPPPPAGQVRNIVVVRPRDPRFREVIYVLREEPFQEGGARREALLQEALSAARQETGRAAARPRRKFWSLPIWPAISLLLGSLLVLKCAGLL